MLLTGSWVGIVGFVMLWVVFGVLSGVGVGRRLLFVVLNRRNKKVFEKFKKANDIQKKQMYEILEREINNLVELLMCMKNEL